MKELLSRYNQYKRNGEKIITSSDIIRSRGTLLHVCLNSSGCRFRKNGSCTMCDYGEGTQLSEKEMGKVLQDISKASNGMNSILIGSLGSVLDPEEVPVKCLTMICEALSQLPIKTIIFETHYTFITNEICQWLQSMLPGKDIVIEVGLESVNEFVQKNCLNKEINLCALESKIKLVHKWKMSLTVNVFLGTPFLTVLEQVEDTNNTIQWAVNHNVDSIVIFPVNIRKHTLLYDLYIEEEFAQLSHWAVFEVLKSIPQWYLDRIYLAWYGDWVDYDRKYNQQDNLPPYGCSICENEWMEFYQMFLLKSDNLERKKLLTKYEKVLSSKCGCKKIFEENMVQSKKDGEKVKKIEKWLKKHLPIAKDK